MINRESSWLLFNYRVLKQFDRDDLPIEERVRFIGIAANNLQEFISVRYSLLENQKAPETSKILSEIKDQKQEIENTYRKTAWYNIFNPPIPKEFTEDYFMERVFPALTPISIDNTKEIPIFEPNELCFFIQLRDDTGPHWCFLQIPHQLSRVQYKKKSMCLIEILIKTYMDKIFGEGKVEGSILFSVHKNYDSEIEIEEGETAISIAKKLLANRKSNRITFLDISREKPEDGKERLGLVKKLIKLLKVPKNNTYMTDCHIMLEMLQDIDSDYPEKVEWKKDLYKPFKPKYPEFLENNGSFFDAIEENDIILHYPYDKFVMANFLEEAANDPDTISIKQTLYRISGNKSPIVKALKKAAKNGIKVTVLIELFARFDEKRNIEIIKSLRKAGCNIVYSPDGLKTHAKMCLVTKRTKTSIKVYSQFGTGNYNEKTAKIYEDFSIFTKRKDIAYQLNSIFNMVSGFNSSIYDEMIVKYSPYTIRKELESMIQRTAKQSENHRAMIFIKVNSLSDQKMIEKIYDTAKKYPNCQFMILCRGICTLDNSELDNVTIRSVVGRFLEHSRIYAAVVDDAAEVYVSSADLMTRNLDYRVEIMVPIIPAKSKEYILAMLNSYWKDTANSSTFENGTWKDVSSDEYNNVHNDFIK